MSLRHFLCLGLLLFIMTNAVRAAPSFCGAHQHTVTLSIKRPGASKAMPVDVTVIMDHEDPFRWYYFPNSLSVAYRGDKPVFSLLRYQLQNPGEKAAELVEGGILQASVTMDLAGLGDSLQEKIATIINNATDPITVKLRSESLKSRGLTKVTGDLVVVSVMPFDTIQVLSVGLPGEELFVKKAHIPSGVGPAYGTQQVPMTLELSRMGTSVFRALTTEGQGGIQVMYTTTYTGITPEIGFTINVDWEKTYNHFSTDVNSRTSMAGNFFGADIEAAVDTSNKQIANKLLEIGAIKVTKIDGGDAYPDINDKIDEYLDPLLEHIYAKIFEDNNAGFEPLSIAESAGAKKNEKAAATLGDLRKENPKDGQVKGDKSKGDNTANNKKAESKPSEADSGEDSESDEEKKGGEADTELGEALDVAGDLAEDNNAIPNIIPCFKTEVSLATLSIDNLKKLEADITFSGRSYVKRTAMIGGFVGIGDYKAEVQDTEGDKLREKLLSSERLLIIVGDDSWDSARFLLPDVKTDFPSFGIESISLTTSILNQNGQPVNIAGEANRLARYSESEGWKGKWVSDNCITWPLLSTAKNAGPENFSKFRYRVVAEIKSKFGRDPIFIDYTVPLETGDSSLSSPLDFLTPVVIDSEQMALEEGEKLIVTLATKGVERTKANTSSEKLRKLVAQFTYSSEIKSIPLLLPPDWTSEGPKKRSSYTFSAEWKSSDEDKFWKEVQLDKERLTPKRRAKDWKTDNSGL